MFNGSDAVAILVPLGTTFAFFLFLGAIIVIGSNNKRIVREKLLDTTRTAVEKGQALPPEVIAALTSEGRSSAFSDLRRGCISIAVGLGFMIFAIVLGFEDGIGQFELNPLFGIAAIPLLIGVAMVVLSRFNPKKD